MMQIREGIGWFTLNLYTSSDNEAQITSIELELSDAKCIDIGNNDNHDIAIDGDYIDTNIITSSVYDEEIEIDETICLDIGKVASFKGDE